MENNQFIENSFHHAAFCDTMNYDEVLNMINMKKRIQQAKALHPYVIHYTKASGYFTSVDDISQPTGKRKIRRCSEENLWEALAEWYLDKNTNLTLADLYAEWLDWKRTPKNQDNIKRIQASWKVYYVNEPLSRELLEKPMACITPLMLRKGVDKISSRLP